MPLRPYIYEDNLPDFLDLDDELFAASFIDDGVRVYPQDAVHAAALRQLENLCRSEDRHGNHDL